LKINNVVKTVDVEPDTPQAAESIGFGGVVEGMSHMQQEITLVDGRVQQTNFHQHPLMRMKQVPPD
jgi:isoquinoline 1-oxidoreductase beta subunit